MSLAIPLFDLKRRPKGEEGEGMKWNEFNHCNGGGSQGCLFPLLLSRLVSYRRTSSVVLKTPLSPNFLRFFLGILSSYGGFWFDCVLVFLH